MKMLVWIVWVLINVLPAWLSMWLLDVCLPTWAECAAVAKQQQER